MSTRTYSLAGPPTQQRDAQAIEYRDTFDCFGGICTVIVADAARPADAAAAVAMAKRALLGWHERFSRFIPDSELMRFNRDPRDTVAVSPMLRRLVEVAVAGSRDTRGLVDATLGGQIERAGYAVHFDRDGIPLAQALSLAPPRAVARSAHASANAKISIDRSAGTITRPPGTILDPGGIAKGVFADELAAMLTGFDAFALDCAGDVRLGGRLATERPVHVASPFDGSTLHTFGLHRGGIATSGIGKRSWLTGDGRPAHHLLDPATGRPAFTGVVQATALAPTGAQAEVLAKAAVLSGPEGAAEWLTHGGVVVRDDGGYAVLEPTGEPAGTRAASQPRISSSTTSRSGSFKISW